MEDVKIRIRNVINITIIRIIQHLNKLYISLTKDIEKENKYEFEDLMPKIDVVKNKQYCESIDWAVQNNKIRNIALTGVYGAGKSTILNTYKREHNEYKYLNISLANFKEDKDENILSNENINIEKAILKQMFYREKNTTIPYSRFKRINSVNYSSIIINMIPLMIVVMLGGLFYKPDLLKVILQRMELLKSNLQINNYILAILMVAFSCAFLFISNKITIYVKKHIKIKKIKTNAGEMEIDEKDESAFNKYIDEILYYFEATKYDIVIFEDLDRFNNIDIFSKLRELNSLINDSKQVNKRVVFIYALKDDMFCSEEEKEDKIIYKDDKISYKNRTKFFDFIIPVVQVANSSNACDLLIRKFKNANQFDGLNEKFISEITILINDMRVLNNIYNEFVIYKENLKEDKNDEDISGVIHDTQDEKSELDYVKLLAIIVYKNVYPVDFAKLQNDEGMVYDIFYNKKNELVKNRLKKINEEIVEIEKDIKVAEHECANNLRELRSIYISEIVKLSSISQIDINNSRYDFNRLIEDENAFHYMIDSRNNSRYYNGSIWTKINLDIIHSQNNGFTYLEREKVIKLKEKNITVNIIEDLKRELKNLNEEKRIVQSLPLSKLLEKCDYNEILIDDIEKENLLKFLIKRNYIDENYYEYISYFYEGTLTRADKNFLMNVMYEKDMSFEYKLQKPQFVLDKIEDFQFTRKYILNYKLVDYLIENIEDNYEYEIYYGLLIDQLANESESSFSFIDGYIYCHEINHNTKEIFIKSLCKKWQHMWTYIQLKSNLVTEKMDMFLRDIIKYADIDDIVNMNVNQILTRYISSLPYFLRLVTDEEYNEKIIMILDRLKVVFIEMDKVNHENEILNHIYINDMYEINEDMIYVIMNHYSSDSIYNVRRANYTAIKNSKCEELIKYIDKNINEYIEKVFLKLNANDSEAEKIIIELLNNEDIEVENKNKIISETKFIINNINKVNIHLLWARLIENCKIKISWSNIISYFEHFNKQIDEIVINFLNEENNYLILSKQSLSEISEFDNSVVDSISQKIILCKEITIDAFKELIKSIKEKYTEFEELKDSSEDKINILINQGILILSPENYIMLKNNFKNEHIKLLVNNINEYVEKYEKYELDAEDIKKLLKSEIYMNYKVFIIEHIEDVEIISDNYLVDMIMECIMEIDKIKLKDVILENIIKSDIHLKTKVMLLNKNIDSLDKNITFKLLNVIGGKYSDITNYSSKPLLNNNHENKVLAKNLKNKNYISSWSEEKFGIRINTYQKEK
ncbi:putative membrane protein YobI [Clostridium beijerinckii]|uniref:YobI-like P-loop NTPase domain-containing protein n=3 Tax=Clostridium beijerinckii TaxID=1520 RepID=A0AB74VIJ2_CLOBE|nr:hypothetical protein [Clostridium beijerinckii]NRZ25407.1 hypothetical protein [Clostridium beijerinckii]NYB97922.1 hypothetical protein [Clostridium beijerinckii]QUN36169.1 hypothetical protein KEC93_04940 [Clostridium beijerinckii]SQB13129.1 Uncharacterised protein [Clostridium beijerinckii]GEP63785.1 putative membrane protein YobI [Clostridium beijerinckii]